MIFFRFSSYSPCCLSPAGHRSSVRWTRPVWYRSYFKVNLWYLVISVSVTWSRLPWSACESWAALMRGWWRSERLFQWPSARPFREIIIYTSLKRRWVILYDLLVCLYFTHQLSEFFFSPVIINLGLLPFKLIRQSKLFDHYTPNDSPNFFYFWSLHFITQTALHCRL